MTINTPTELTSQPCAHFSTMALPAIYHGGNTALSLSSITRLLDDYYKGNLKLPPKTRDQLLLDQEELTGYSRYIANSY